MRTKLTLILLCFMTAIQGQNPFFESYNTPHNTTPFDRIRPEHFEPAVREGIKRQQAEIDAIVNNTEAPTFENTILPYEQSGELLQRAATVFDNLLSAETNDELQELAKTLMPLMNTPFRPGECLLCLQRMEPGPRQEIAWAEYYYFSGQPERAIEMAEQFLHSPDMDTKLSACLLFVFANLSVGDIQRARQALSKLQDALTEPDSQNPVLLAAAPFTAAAAAVLIALSAAVITGGVLGRLRLPVFLQLRTMGAPRRYVALVVWLLIVTVAASGAVSGLVLGTVGAFGAAVALTNETGIAMSPALGLSEAKIVLTTLAAGGLFALLPAVAAGRAKLN